ncbi:hypothetical protein [Neomegalonema perideroedes]|uniref:hypothetical protein n=1 Tax=Neomegalonema perideroedes TaxID=217219 RepID=UPI00036E782B|nr:hypothetical protein [Neomegalonema perideroedes]
MSGEILGFRPAAPSTRTTPLAGRAAEALTALGRLYLTQGFPEQALALLLSAQRRAPRDGEVLRLLACAHLLTDAPEKTLAVLDKLEPTLAEAEDLRAALHLRARALLALGRVREAQALFDERRRV